MRPRLLLLIAALMLVAVWPLRAAQPAATARGFDADRIYQMGDIDSVNAMNGNLIITIPIGPSFTAGDTLSYRFTLVYNSSFWDYEQPGGFGLPSDPPLFRDDSDWAEAIPDRASNAGVGWRLSLGDMMRDVYIGADGVRHTFSPGLHFENPPASNISYTRDGSYLRKSGTTVDPVIEFPDGTKQVFHCTTSGCQSALPRDRRFELTSIIDAYGNAVVVSRRMEGTLWVWTFTEHRAAPGDPGIVTTTSDETSHVLKFRPYAHAPYSWLVDTLELAGPNGTRSTYKFDYDLNRSLYRDVHHRAPVSGTSTQPGNDALIAPLLTGVRVLEADVDPGRWSFQYHDGTPTTEPIGTSRPYTTSSTSGKLTRIELPTHGAVDYEYGAYVQPLKRCGTRPPQNPRFVSTGIRKRQWLKPQNGQLVAEGAPWLYGSQAGPEHSDNNPNPELQCRWQESFRTTIVDPLKGATVSYFQITPGSLDTPVSGWAFHGLPLSPDNPDPTTSGATARYLSTQVYQCPAGYAPPDGGTGDVGTACIATPSCPSCGLKRETYVRYEHSAQSCGPEGGTGCTDGNRRLVERRTIYSDDVERGFTASRLVENRDFDGLGHFRTVIESGNFSLLNFANGPHRGERRTTFTNYNPGVTFSPSGSFSGVPASMPWILGTYDLTWVREDGVPGGLAERVEETDFDRQTGRLRRKRILADGHPPATPDADPGRKAQDLLTVYDRTLGSGGTVTLTEKSYGGDRQSIPTEPFSTINLSTFDPEYSLRTVLGLADPATPHQYPVTNEYLGCDDTRFLLLETASVDRATGAAHSSVATSGKKTSYAYDRLGRLSSAAPDGETASVISYPANLNTAAPPFQVTVSRGSALETGHRYDHRGRGVGTGSRIPERNNSGTMVLRWEWSQREFEANGWTKADWTTGATSDGATTYKDYDPFGRPQTIVHPDAVNGSRKTEIFYKGERLLQRKVGPVITTEKYDSLGRLIFISEGNIPATRYDYDVTGGILEVQPPGTPIQRRRFTRDGRGFLRREEAPELAGKSLQYLYDSRGNVRERLLGAAPLSLGGALPARGRFDLSYCYDAAERPVSVVAPAGNQTLKSYTYYSRNDTASRRAGMLQSATRNNRVPRPLRTHETIEIPVTTVYNYDASHGRLASTTVSMPSRGRAFTTTIGYDGIGNPTSLRYPLDGGIAIDRTVQMSYTQGRLTGIPTFASSILYAPSGMVHEVKRGNSWIDRFQPDGRNLPRFQSIEFLKNGPALSDMTIGPFSYDVRGNIDAIGTNGFVYDDASRLIQATLTGGLIQNYEYDHHGNLDRISGAGTVVDPVIDAATNRISSIASVAPKYDDAGNMIELPDLPNNETPPRPPLRYEYDPLSMITHSQSKQVGRIFVYDAADERVGVLDYAFPVNGDGNLTNDLIRETWSLRGPGNMVLRDVEGEISGNLTAGGSFPLAGNWKWSRDYVYRGSALLASVGPLASGQQTRHLHTDHLGTVRYVTDQNGAVVENRRYFPFGTEISPAANVERHKFTGHERDDNGSNRPWGDIDYMHARYYAPFLGRFLSVDPLGGDISTPQSWNRYAYALNNSMRYVDPNGRATAEPATSAAPPDVCDDNGCTTTVIARDPARDANYGLNYRLGGKRYTHDSGFPRQYMLPCGSAECYSANMMSASDHDELMIAESNAIMGWADNVIGFHPDGPTPGNVVTTFADVVGYDDYARKKGLVDTESTAYQVGVIAGWVTTAVIMTGVGSPKAPRPAPQPPRPRVRGGRYVDGELVYPARQPPHYK